MSYENLFLFLPKKKKKKKTTSFVKNNTLTNFNIPGKK